jgi:hypothetical protein
MDIYMSCLVQILNIHRPIYIVVYRAVTRQRPRDKQLNQSCFRVTAANKRVSKTTNKHNNRGIAQNGVFYGGPCRKVIRRTTGARIQAVVREQPFRQNFSTEAEKYPLLEAFTRQLLVKTLQAGKDLAVL